MTNKEEMLGGALYDAMDEELVTERQEARKILRELNESFGKDQSRQKQLLQKLFGRIGRESWIEVPFYCDYGSNIYLGEEVYFNFNCTILDPAKVKIGDRCLLGPNVQIYTATHPLESKERKKGLESAQEIFIDNDVWIGGAAIILPGIEIGSESVIGAGSVVTKNIPENVFAAGNPCKVIKKI